ncbi:hypothetical protein, partial [Streptomyces sp. NPDC051992]|uniref:hypothetical protein n=1 Tax=Streptomyces sp. NPDC051992 TaxID=3161012 RepID=UPI00341425DC
TRMSDYENAPVPTIVRGEGTYIFDDQGKRYRSERHRHRRATPAGDPAGVASAQFLRARRAG